MFILLAFGYFLYKKKLLSDESTKQLSAIAINIICPIVIFNSYQTEYDPSLLTGLLISIGLAAIAHLVLILFSRIVVRKGENKEIERFAISYSNCAFMGIPLVEATFGTEGVFYLTGYITVFNLLMWTHGNLLMQGSSSLSPKAFLKVLCSPAILSIVLGMIFFFTGVRLPDIITSPLNYLGALNTPLAMMVSGATIAKAGLAGAFTNRRIYFIQSFKLLIAPAVIALLTVPLIQFGVSEIIVNTNLIAAAAPTASATIMFAYKHSRNAEYASYHFALSTASGMLTMPLVLMLSAFLSQMLAI